MELIIGLFIGITIGILVTYNTIRTNDLLKELILLKQSSNKAKVELDIFKQQLESKVTELEQIAKPSIDINKLQEQFEDAGLAIPEVDIKNTKIKFGQNSLNGHYKL